MKPSAKLFFTSLVVFMGLLNSSAKAESVFENKEAESEARTVFSSGGNYFLALNTTYLIYYGLLLGLALLALLALSGLGGSSADGYGSGYQRFSQQESGENFHHQRQRRGISWDSGMIYIMKNFIT